MGVVAEDDEEALPPGSAPMLYASRSVGDAWAARSSRTVTDLGVEVAPAAC